MANKKTSRRALILSAVSLILCLAMLTGTTFAWFTDNVTTARNSIQSGNLDVVLEYKTEWSDTWTTVDSNTKIFEDYALYEPGYTEVVFLRVSNAGSLALKYQLNVNIASEKTSTNVAGDTFKLSDYLEVGAYIQDEYSSGANYANILMPTMFGTRQGAVNSVEASGTGFTKLNTASAYGNNTVLEAGTDTAQVIALVLRMPETVGNEANHKTGVAAPEIILGVDLMATQAVVEEDSFGPDYDADAQYAPSDVPQAFVQTLNVPKQNMYIIPDITQGFGGGSDVEVEPAAAFTFVALDDETSVQESPYKDWLVDYYVSVDKTVNDGLTLIGNYGNWQGGAWYGFKVPAGDYPDAVALLGTMTGGTSNWTYADIVTGVGTFNCGVADDGSNTGMTMTVELRLINPDNTSEMITVSSTDYVCK